MTGDKPLLGITLMLGFCIMAPLGDSLAKLLGSRMDVGQLVLIRFATQFLILTPLVWLAGRSLFVPRALFPTIVARAVLHILGIGMMFEALKYLPLADAVAIAFVMPFIMLALGHYFLGEAVGARRIIACGVGFIGTLMVVQPSFAAVGWPALLPLGVAIVFAFFMLLTRKVAKALDPIDLQATSAGLALVMAVPIVVAGHTFDVTGATLTWPRVDDWSLVIMLGLLGTLAHLAMTWSLRFAPSATLAPMKYLEIPAAAVIGWLVFSDFPNGLALIGIVVTVLAGLYIVMRERATMQPTQE
ncbi:MAG: DMT family transporter [Boseongicola sp.]|nr:DMT family transporter [Boseongicola sp.]